MLVKTKKIKVLGDDIIQLVVKKPKKEPHKEFQVLSEMGWRINEEDSNQDDSEMVTLELKSYPLKHTIKVIYPIMTTVGDPQESFVSGRVILPATVIKAENLMDCLITSNEIKCETLQEDIHERIQNSSFFFYVLNISK